MITWLLWVACTGGTGDTGTDTDTVTSEPETVYPSGERVLIYTGHNGEDGNSSGAGEFDEASDWIKATYGWNVSSRSDLADPTQYRLIVLLDSGLKGDSVFGESSVALLNEALEAGVRVVATVGRDNCEATTLNLLFEDLGVNSRFTGEGSSVAKVSVVAPARTQQFTQGVSEARFVEPCWVDANAATVLFSDDRDAIVTLEQVGNGGEVILMGAYSWFDDRGYLDDADHRVLLGNMVEIDPDLGPLAGDSGG